MGLYRQRRALIFGACLCSLAAAGCATGHVIPPTIIKIKSDDWQGSGSLSLSLRAALGSLPRSVERSKARPNEFHVRLRPDPQLKMIVEVDKAATRLRLSLTRHPHPPTPDQRFTPYEFVTFQKASGRIRMRFEQGVAPDKQATAAGSTSGEAGKKPPSKGKQKPVEWKRAPSPYPTFLGEGSHAFWAKFAFGGLFGMVGMPSQFMLTETVGYHFFGAGQGPALAFDLAQSVGGGAFFFEMGPRFLWDIPILDQLGLTLTPGAGLGYAYQSGPCWHTGAYMPGTPTEYCASTSGFYMNFMFEGRLVIKDFYMASFRPFGLNLVINGEGVALGWEFMFGGGVTFW